MLGFNTSVKVRAPFVKVFCVLPFKHLGDAKSSVTRALSVDGSSEGEAVRPLGEIFAVKVRPVPVTSIWMWFLSNVSYICTVWTDTLVFHVRFIFTAGINCGMMMPFLKKEGFRLVTFNIWENVLATKIIFLPFLRTVHIYIQAR